MTRTLTCCLLGRRVEPTDVLITVRMSKSLLGSVSIINTSFFLQLPVCVSMEEEKFLSTQMHELKYLTVLASTF
jgi:hypothetical protein